MQKNDQSRLAKPMDLTGLDPIMAERWQDVSRRLEAEFMNGFVAGYACDHWGVERQSEAFRYGFSDGYTLAQMEDNGFRRQR